MWLWPARLQLGMLVRVLTESDLGSRQGARNDAGADARAVIGLTFGVCATCPAPATRSPPGRNGRLTAGLRNREPVSVATACDRHWQRDGRLGYERTPPRPGWCVAVRDLLDRLGRAGLLIRAGRGSRTGPDLGVCWLEQLGHRSAHDHLAADHLRALEVELAQLLTHELQRQVIG